MPSLLAHALSLTTLLLQVGWAAVSGAVSHHLPLFSVAWGPPPPWLLRAAGWLARSATALESAVLPGEAVLARRLGAALSASVDAALADLGVVPALCDTEQRRGGGGGTTAAGLARRLGVLDATFLFRLLRAGAATGVVAVVGTSDDAADSLTAVRFGPRPSSRPCPGG